MLSAKRACASDEGVPVLRLLRARNEMEDPAAAVVEEQDAQIGGNFPAPEGVLVIEEAQVPDAAEGGPAACLRVAAGSGETAVDAVDAPVAAHLDILRQGEVLGVAHRRGVAERQGGAFRHRGQKALHDRGVRKGLGIEVPGHGSHAPVARNPSLGKGGIGMAWLGSQAFQQLAAPGLHGPCEALEEVWAGTVRRDVPVDCRRMGAKVLLEALAHDVAAHGGDEVGPKRFRQAFGGACQHEVEKAGKALFALDGAKVGQMLGKDHAALGHESLQRRLETQVRQLLADDDQRSPGALPLLPHARGKLELPALLPADDARFRQGFGAEVVQGLGKGHIDVHRP